MQEVTGVDSGIPGERAVLDLARGVLHDSETKLLREIESAVPNARHNEALTERRPEAPAISGLQWLKGAVRARRGQGPVEAFHRVQHLLAVQGDRNAMREIPLALAKAYAARVARTKLIRFAPLRRTTRTISLVYFMKIGMWRAADDTIETWLMQVSERRGRHTGRRSGPEKRYGNSGSKISSGGSQRLRASAG